VPRNRSASSRNPDKIPINIVYGNAEFVAHRRLVVPVVLLDKFTGCFQRNWS
jgi:hypothetical protein